ncbi:transmembrane protein PVRIG [Rhinatrema bivittatum]|uniref:transmembrane protein PVRIG n=1 Tax=Rhinatrema bivittatum TaxID=194408 RepID=UPI00112B80E0|nr:transmembrane protein PVRIG [Rhinatrema bivittatum]
MPRALVLMGFLLLTCIETGIIIPRVHIWTETPQKQGEPLKVGCSLSRQDEHIVQVNWGRREWNETTTIIAVFHPKLGVSIHHEYRESLHLHRESDDNISISLSGGNRTDRNSSYCCKFITYPAGNTEACIGVSLTALEDPFSSKANLRTDVLGTLLVGACFLLGIIILLYNIVRTRVRRPLQHENLHHISERQGAATERPQARDGARRSFPAWCMINLEYFSNVFHRKVAPRAGREPFPARPPADFVSMENKLYAEAAAATGHTRNGEEQQPGASGSSCD